MAEFFKTVRDVPFNEPCGSGPLVVDFPSVRCDIRALVEIRVSVG